MTYIKLNLSQEGKLKQVHFKMQIPLRAIFLTCKLWRNIDFSQRYTTNLFAEIAWKLSGVEILHSKSWKNYYDFKFRGSKLVAMVNEIKKHKIQLDTIRIFENFIIFRQLDHESM